MNLRQWADDVAVEAVTPDGANLKGWMRGSSSRTLLLVSGLGGSAAFWRAASAALARDLQVLRFDQRGIGHSTRGTAECTIRTLAEDCLTMLDAAGIERCVVLGHSTGGCIAQTLTCVAPDRFEGAILSGTWLKPGAYMQSLFDARRELLTVSPAAYAVNATLISYPPDWLQKNMQVVAASRANAPASAEARAIVEQRIEALLAFDGTEQASQLQLPIQVFSARDDLVIPSFMQDELVAALPQASLVNFRQGGHFFPVSRHDAFVRKVRSWIKKL